MLQAAELYIGDLVRLNSGSPDLRIIASDARKVAVEWHNGTDREIALFPKVCVRQVAQISD